MTRITTATGTSNESEPLRKIVTAFVEAQAKVLATGVSGPSDWAPMARFLEVDKFKRVGAYLEEFSYTEYCEFMTGWAAGGTHFEMTEFYSTEVGNTVFQEIEERHHRGDLVQALDALDNEREGTDDGDERSQRIGSAVRHLNYCRCV